MSLLLDALKKAADDKQKASQGDVSQKESVTEEVTGNDEAPVPAEELSLQEIDNATVKNEGEPVTELMLDDVESEVRHVSSENDPVSGDVENAAVIVDSVEKSAADELSLESDTSSRGSYTVSDDALSMLIYKTNRGVRQRKKIFFFSVIIISLAILVAGGVFYYIDMQAEIANLERKHQIAMQSMRLKTNRGKMPNNSVIIRNLVGEESNLDKKIQNAKQQSVTQSVAVRPRAALNKTDRSSPVKVSPVLSIQKTNKIDPVGEKLDAAWLAYESTHYTEAGKLYKDVLFLEKNNRDALLGLAAIAVIEKDNTKARGFYLSLLELDPRDPIASAALISFRSDASSLDSDREYLLAMLEKNPEAHHLSFAVGNNYAQQNKWKLAQQYYFDAWQRNNENADYLYNLAISMDQLNKHKQAIRFYKESLLNAENKQISFSPEAVKKRINELSRL